MKIQNIQWLEIKALLEGVEGDLQQGILKENFAFLTVSGFSLSEERKYWNFCETGGAFSAISHCFEGKVFQPRGEMGRRGKETHTTSTQVFVLLHGLKVKS